MRMRVLLCVVATSVKLTLHTVAQTFLRFQVALVEATKTANRKRVQTAIVKLKSKVTSCAMLFSPACVVQTTRTLIAGSGKDIRP